MIVILMGVAGSGKTTIGRLLAAQTGWAFYDGDDFHPPANVAKMRRGEPLDDADRGPWLAALAALIGDSLARGDDAVIACSALKAAYRAALQVDPVQVRFVYLRGEPDLLRARLETRTGHFAGVDLLASQLDALEEPAGALVVDIAQNPEQIVAAILRSVG